MPHANILAMSADVPLTVTAVAKRLGVSASTLRTWERRYGLGPSQRAVGAHRRYLPHDVARLQRMVELIHSGVSAADAAAIARTNRLDPAEGPSATCSDDIVKAAQEAAQTGAAGTLHAMLAHAITADGLTRTWADLIEPAMETILASSEGEDPGNAPSAVVTVEVLSVLRAMAAQRPATPASSIEVVIMTDQDHTLAAHIVGEALQWQGANVSVMSSGYYRGASGVQRFRDHARQHRPLVAIIMGRGAQCEHLIGQIAATDGINVVVVGEDSPTYLDVHVQRVRTLTACVDETVALMREKQRENSVVVGERTALVDAGVDQAATGVEQTTVRVGQLTH